MSKKDQFKRFGKKSSTKQLKEKSNNAVIYTRVSSQGQVDNYSLQAQYNNCKAFAEGNDLIVSKLFGATHESAKTDNRNEFDKMLSFVKDPKNEISYIIVADIDRFSRTGDSAISIQEELSKIGVMICAAIDGTIKLGTSDETFKSIKMVLAKAENDTRTRKCREGTISRLKDGYWLGSVPKGYEKVDKKTLRFTDEAKFIKEAFLLKREGFINRTIIEKVNAKGATLTKSRLSAYFRNPFYCGYLSSSYLDGEIVRGRHESLISEELFLEVNGLVERNPQGYKSEKQNESRPLQADLKCSCGGVYTGYCKKGKYHYYKCNGCKHNCSVGTMHNLFEDFLNQYAFSAAYVKLFEKQLKLTFKHLNIDNAVKQKELKSTLTKLKNNKKVADEKLAFGIISQSIYDNATRDLAPNINSIEKEIDELDFNLSNSNEYITKSFEILSDFGGLWSSSSLEIRREIQNLVFNNHIQYDNENKLYRTPFVNSLFSIMAEGLGQKKEGQKDDEVNLSHFVPWAGIEPALPKKLDFESSASTNSATKA
jgi:site-specific DNA recombinase